MNLPTTSRFVLSSEGFAVNVNQLLELNIAALIDTAQNNRPEYQMALLHEEYAQKYLAVERAERIPNLALIGERSEEHTSELQSRPHLVCRLLLEKKNKKKQEEKTDT